MKPNRTQFEAAKLVIAKYGREYRGVGTDLHQNTAAMAVWCILSGQLDKTPGEYRDCIDDVMLAPALDNEAAEVVNEELERLHRIGSGVEVGKPEGMDEVTGDFLGLGEAAAELLGVKPGHYIHIDDAMAGMPDDEDEDAEPNEDGKGTVDFDAMTVDVLKKFAEDNNVDLTGISKKADIVAALKEFKF